MSLFEWIFLIIVGIVVGYLWVESGDRLARKYYEYDESIDDEDNNNV